MGKRASPSQNFAALFPGIKLWMQFPAFLSWCAISIGVLIVSLFSHMKHLSTLQGSFYNIVVIIAIVSLILGILTVKRKSFCFLSFLIAGASCYLIYLINQEKNFTQLSESNTESCTIYGTVASPSLPYPDNIRFLFSIDSTSMNAGNFRGQIFQCYGREPVQQGMHLKLTGMVQIPSRRVNPYEFDEYSYLVSNGISAKFKVKSIDMPDSLMSVINKISNQFRKDVSQVIARNFSSDQRAILFAAFLGETEYLSPHLKNSFRSSGIYHLLSISGLHAAMLIGACYFLLSFFPVRMLYSHIAALSIVWMYQCFIGFIPCLFRATVMATLIVATFLYQKKSYPIQSLGLAGTIWLLLSPGSLFQPSFQFSFAATFGILTLYPLLNRFQPEIPNRFIQFAASGVLSSLYLSFTGLVSTIPVSLYHFGTVSIYGLIENLIAVPLMTLAMYGFFAAAATASLLPFASTCFSWICQFLLDIIITTSDYSLQVPFSTLYLKAMPTTLTILFISFMLLVVTIERKHLRTLCAFSLPVIIGFTALIILLQRYRQDITLTRFIIEKSSTYTIKWRSGAIWVFISGDSPFVIKKAVRAVTSWYRHQAGAEIDAVIAAGRIVPDPELYIFGNTKPSSIIAMKQPGIPYVTTYLIESKEGMYRSSDTCALALSKDSIGVRISGLKSSIYFALPKDVPLIYINDSLQQQLPSKSFTIKLQKNARTTILEL